MIPPCFRVQCPHVKKGLRPFYKQRVFEGKLPIEFQPKKNFAGVEELCKECWDSLPEKEKFDSVLIQQKLNPNNYRHMEKEKWNGI